ncbi:hypothetical protein GOBAR_AA24240 [Gossypium barbadense]|uniref:Uncharacterized protein n=1 Tax=Gossypium barbadense TaxID=3634 RepID=A0A2P5WZC8_GOSBA|nr:hypothetical protein GOBAR_AA24240 [Gossypium barbadense]
MLQDVLKELTIHGTEWNISKQANMPYSTSTQSTVDPKVQSEQLPYGICCNTCISNNKLVGSTRRSKMTQAGSKIMQEDFNKPRQDDDHVEVETASESSESN